ncbi:unnamed protein product [Chrysoparadoxa australica]
MSRLDKDQASDRKAKAATKASERGGAKAPLFSVRKNGEGSSRGANTVAGHKATARQFSESDSMYWDSRPRPMLVKDLGHHCRECRQPFTSLKEGDIMVRRGGRIELRYHLKCFSGENDPRSQHRGTAQEGQWVSLLKGTKAPNEMYKKMRTRSHW